jgi:maleamate amidohydrolase
MTRIWDSFLTEQDKAHVAANGARPTFGFGAVPVVLSIDNYRWVIGDKPQPLMESIKDWPGSTGLAGWQALSHTETLFGQVRNAGIPIVHITGLSEAESGVAPWSRGRGGKALRTRRPSTARHGGSTSSSRPLRCRVRQSCARPRPVRSSARP